MTFTAETWTTGTTTNRTFGSTYNTVGNLLTVQDSVSNAPDFTFTYDARNQVQLEQQSYFPGISSLNIDRDYDSTGNRTRTAVNIGGTITAGTPGTGGTIAGGINDLMNVYGYDRLYRLTSVSQRTATAGTVNTVAPKFASFNYNVASQMTDSRRFSDVTSTPANLEVHSRYAYDGAARLTSITHAKTEIAAGQAWNGTATLPASITPANTIAAYAFTYDRDNRMTSLASYADRFTTSFVYDPTDQLTAATSVAIAGLAAPAPLPTAESYNLDANGNRNTSGGVSQSAAGTYNRLQTDGRFNYTYDYEGNVTRKTRISDNTYTVYTWNHRNQLTDVSERTSANALTKRTVYEYDAFGRRVMDSLDRTGDGIYDQIDRWFHDGPDRLFQIRDSDGQGTAQVFRISNRYLHGDATDRVIADEQFASGLGPAYQSAAASTATGTTLWSVADQLGSARDLVDNSGIVRKHVIYDSFGKRLSEVNRAAGTGAVLPALSALAVDSVFGYTGADWDADVGLTNHDARWYDANTGRWLSQDPIGFAAQDPNLYRYVGNSANNAADPSGLDWWPKALTLEFWVGGGSASKEQQEDTRKANALRNEMLMPYDSLQNARDRSKFAGEYPGAILDTAENTAIEIATTFIPGPADNACVNGVRANRMKNLQKAADKAEDALSASKGIRSKIGHVTPWGQMTTAQRKAFQHSYTRHASELGLPNWSQKNAEALRCQFNNIVGHIRDNGTMLPPGIKKPFNGRWT